MLPATGIHAPLLQEKKQGEKRASVYGAVFNVSTSIIGAGIMSIPATLKVLGVIPAFLLITIVAWLVDISVKFLLRYTHSGDTTTYAGVMREAFGRVGSVSVQVCVMITNLGCLIIYLIIIGKCIYLCMELGCNLCLVLVSEVIDTGICLSALLIRHSALEFE